MTELTVSLCTALRLAEVPGGGDVWSGLGEVYLPSVDAWVPAQPKVRLAVGKNYWFRDRTGRETAFVACSPTLEDLEKLRAEQEAIMRELEQAMATRDELLTKLEKLENKW